MSKKKSPAQRIAHLEEVCIFAGFLLKNLLGRYGDDFGIGIDEQVRQCIRDCEQIAKASEQRARSVPVVTP